MKKLIALILLLALFASSVFGCTSETPNDEPNKDTQDDIKEEEKEPEEEDKQEELEEMDATQKVMAKYTPKANGSSAGNKKE